MISHLKAATRIRKKLGVALLRGNNDDISTSIAPPGVPGVAKNREGPSDIDFKGFGCNHEVSEELEAKNVYNLGIFEQIWLLLRGFVF